MGSHQSQKSITDSWFTPQALLWKLGEFDLDPCSSEDRPWRTAGTHFHERGLEQEWFGRVWLNPPYSREVGKWLQKMSDHARGIALTFARTETHWFKNTIWDSPTASGILFIYQRLYFHYPDGRKARHNGGAPSVLISYGEEDAFLLKSSGVRGKFLKL